MRELACSAYRRVWERQRASNSFRNSGCLKIIAQALVRALEHDFECARKSFWTERGPPNASRACKSARNPSGCTNHFYCLCRGGRLTPPNTAACLLRKEGLRQPTLAHARLAEFGAFHRHLARVDRRSLVRVAA